MEPLTRTPALLCACRRTVVGIRCKDGVVLVSGVCPPSLWAERRSGIARAEQDPMQQPRATAPIWLPAGALG